MKKLLAIALLATTANVATADQDIGCGLGSMIMAGQSGPVFKVLGPPPTAQFLATRLLASPLVPWAASPPVP